MNIEEIENDLSKIMDHVMSLGWTFCEKYSYCANGKLCCALGSHMVMDEDSRKHDWMWIAQEKYRLNYKEVLAFVDGFDGNKYSNNDNDNLPYYELGQRLRFKYKPINLKKRLYYDTATSF